MTRYFSLFLFISLTFVSRAAGLSFSGIGSASVTISPDSSTGLDALYVIENSENVTATYIASSPSSNVNWLRFGKSGGAYAEEIPFQINGSERNVTIGKDDVGYIIEENNRRYFFWIINYANHPFNISSIEVNRDDTDCLTVALVPDGMGDKINYYSITGLSKELSREIIISYTTLKYMEVEDFYREISVETIFSSLSPIMRVNAPLCDTSFTISGDRFLREWGKKQSAVSSYYETKAIECETSAIQIDRENDNESSDNTTGLGGSAPVDIIFNAAITDAVKFTEWQFAKDADFMDIDLRFNQPEISYTFRDYGTTYVRFMASNFDGDCDVYGPTYEVYVGESKLLCPNAFSPGSSPGVNDEWKVSYKSIVEFECHIFNRWGTKIITLTDPSQGWNGKYRGKIVSPGVYYYVIKAKGADGHKYNLSGDINIINYKSQYPSSGSGSE